MRKMKKKRRQEEKNAEERKKGKKEREDKRLLELANVHLKSIGDVKSINIKTIK